MSGRAQTIVILTHLRQGLDADYNLARCKTYAWEREGRRVLVHQGTRDPSPQADIAILHVDLTVVPPDYLALAARYPRCVNGAVADISKRRISRWLVARDDAYDGAVVVKHDRNHGGASERRLRLAEGGLAVRLREAALRWLPPAWGGLYGDYQLFHRKTQVPAWVWQRQDLVVERFFVERHGEGYALHQWHFLGPRGVVSTFVGETPLVKWHPTTQRLPIHHRVPEALWQRRRELGMEFGKLDFILHEGEAVLLDANPTPHVGTAELHERSLYITGVLAAGIDFLL